MRTRWRLLLAIAALGAVIGGAASLLWPPAYESASQVLVQGDPDEALVRSEAQVAMSLAVLDRAAAGLNWGMDGSGLRDSVTAAVADGNVIEIKAKADTPDRARQLAEQVTQQYVAFSTDILTKSVSAPGNVLAPRRDSLQKQVTDLNRRISELQGSVGVLDATNPQGATARAELQQLSSNRTDAVKELSDLDARIAKAQAQAATSAAIFTVIERPVTPRAPVTPTRLELVAAGAGIADVLGVFVLVGLRRADRRLRRASDIAAALGAPVLGTVQAPVEVPVRLVTNGSRNGHDGGVRRHLRQQRLRNGAPWNGAQSLEHVRYRRVLALLQKAPHKSIRLLVIVADNDELASRAVGRLAVAAAAGSQGVSVVTDSPSLAETVKAFVPTDHAGQATINVDIITSADHTRSAHATVLKIVSVDAARPTVPDCDDVSAALLVVTSGTRTAWELLAIAEACHDAGHAVKGTLIVLTAAHDEEAEDFDPEQMLSAGAGPPRGRPGRSLA